MVRNIASFELEGKLCEALGVRPDKVARIVLDLRAGETVRAYVELIGDEGLLSFDFKTFMEGHEVSFSGEPDGNADSAASFDVLIGGQWVMVYLYKNPKDGDPFDLENGFTFTSEIPKRHDYRKVLIGRTTKITVKNFANKMRQMGYEVRENPDAKES